MACYMDNIIFYKYIITCGGHCRLMPKQVSKSCQEMFIKLKYSSFMKTRFRLIYSAQLKFYCLSWLNIN
jgi:hypothetical protein